MTDEEINIAIAKTCGWKFIPEYCHGENQPPEFTTVTPDGKHLCGYHPDYCNDLNAMHEAEKELINQSLFQDYWPILEKITCSSRLVHATARQKAKAFLKTFNLWTE